MLTHQSLLTVIHRQKYSTLKALSKEVKKTAKRLGQPITMSRAYELTRTNLMYLERQNKVRRSNKGKTFYISSKRYKEALNDLKQKLLEFIAQGYDTPRAMRSIPLSRCKERIGISLISRLLKELEEEGKIKREGLLTKGRIKIYSLCEPDAVVQQQPQNPSEEQSKQISLLNLIHQLSQRQPHTTAHELAKKSGYPLEEVKRELKNLQAKELINEKKVGYLSLYQINEIKSQDIQQLQLGILYNTTNSTAPFELDPTQKINKKTYSFTANSKIHPAFRGKNKRLKTITSKNGASKDGSKDVASSALWILEKSNALFHLMTEENKATLSFIFHESHLALAPPA